MAEMSATVIGSTAAEQVRRVQLDVSGMFCGACAVRVQKRLNKLDGVRASVNYATRVATVDAPEDVAADELCEVVRRAGYEAEPRTTSQGMTGPTPTRRRHAPCCCGWRSPRSCSFRWPTSQ